VIPASLEKHLWYADRCGEMKRVPLNLHRLWDGVITSTDNVGRLRNIATELLSKFSRVGLRELDQRLPEAWAKESYEVAVKIAYENEIFDNPERTDSGLPRGTGRELRIPWVSGES
jgi:hypothetical protein